MILSSYSENAFEIIADPCFLGFMSFEVRQVHFAFPGSVELLMLPQTLRSYFSIHYEHLQVYILVATKYQFLGAMRVLPLRPTGPSQYSMCIMQ